MDVILDQRSLDALELLVRMDVILRSAIPGRIQIRVQIHHDGICADGRAPR